MISSEEIKKLGLLARIELNAGEEKELQRELEAILGYVSKLKEASVDANQGPSFLKSSRTVLNGLPEISNVFRADEPLEDKSEIKKGEHIKVKHIL